MLQLIVKHLASSSEKRLSLWGLCADLKLQLETEALWAAAVSFPCLSLLRLERFSSTCVQAGVAGSWHRLPAAGQGGSWGRRQGHEAGRRPPGLPGSFPLLCLANCFDSLGWRSCLRLHKPCMLHDKCIVCIAFSCSASVESLPKKQAEKKAIRILDLSRALISHGAAFPKVDLSASQHPRLKARANP